MNDLQELSTFSHEINNSLTLIYGQIQYIEKTNDTLTKNEHWNRMKDDFSSLFDFIHQFLAPADTTSAAAIEPLDLINLISEIRSSQRTNPVLYSGRSGNRILCVRCKKQIIPVIS